MHVRKRPAAASTGAEQDHPLESAMSLALDAVVESSGEECGCGTRFIMMWRI